MRVHLLFSPRALAEGRLVALCCEAARCLHHGARPSDMPLLIDEIASLHAKLGAR